MIEVDKLDILKTASTQLEQVPYYRIFDIISKLRLRSMISFHVPKGATITRVVQNNQGVPISQISQISYNPNPGANYGRVNLPKESIFYGSINVPNTKEPKEVNVWELIHILQSQGYKIPNNDFEFITGTWILKSDMPVILAGFTENEIKRNSLFYPVYEKFRNHNKLNEKDIEIMKFFAREFSKSKIKNNSDYKITCAIKEYLFKRSPKKVQAILYPSVRSDKLGYNIAITPEFVDQYLKLYGVSFNRMYGGDPCVVDIEKKTDIINNDGSFDLENRPFEGIGKDECLKLMKEAKKNT